MKKWLITIALISVLAGIWVSGRRALEKQPVVLGAATPKIFKIGALIPLSGKFAFYGEDMRNAMELAREEFLKIYNLSLNIVYEDSAAEAKLASAAAKKLIEIDRVPIIIGGPGSTANLAVAPLMENSQTVFLPISANPKLNSAGEYIFKLHPDYDGEITRMSRHIYDKGFRKLAVLYDSSSDTQTFAKDFLIKEFARLGGKVVKAEGSDSQIASDFRSQLAKLKQVKPEALYLFLVEKVAGQAVKQARETGLSQPIFGATAFASPEFLTTAGRAAEGVVITDQPFSCQGNLAMRDYCRRYRQKFVGLQPTQYGAHAYDAAQIIVKLARQEGYDPEKIRQGLLQVKGYFGVSGEFSFDEQGNIRDKDFVFRVVKDGKFVDLK